MKKCIMFLIAAFLLSFTAKAQNDVYEYLPAIMVGAHNNLQDEQAEVAVMSWPNTSDIEKVKPGDYMLWYDVESNQFQCEIKDVKPIPTKISEKSSIQGPFYQVSVKCLSKFLDSKIANEFQYTRNVMFVSSTNRPDYLPGQGGK